MTSAEPTLLADAVHRAIADQIFSGELPPGASLSVPALATRLGVSRSPVRESVQRLIYEGLAVHTPHAGAKVATIDSDAVAQVLEVREVLDGLAAYQATLVVSNDEVAALRAMVAEQDGMLADPADPDREARLDLSFHTAVRDLADNRPLSNALQRLDAQAHLYRSGMWSHQRNREMAVAEHRRILDAIDAGDADGARAAASAHVAAIRVRMRRWLDEPA